MKAGRILALAAGAESRASTRYRLLAHRPALERAGFEVRVCYPVGRRLAPRRLWRALDLLRDRVGLPAADLLFLQRKTYPPWVARGLGGRVRRVVLDMDDAIDLPAPGRGDEPRRLRRYRDNFEATAARADLVLCGNRELASRLPHQRYALVLTAIDMARFVPDGDPARHGKTLGWVGHSDNLGYLESLAGPLRELARRHPDLRLHVVADRPPRLAGLDVRFRTWSLEREASCLHGFRVGLMPLDDTPWARGKCAFKAIQYMASGVPTVASPVGMNREVIEHGRTGFLAGRPEEWVEQLDALLVDPLLVRRIGRAGRESVEARYSLDVVSRSLVDRLTELLED